MRNSKNHAEAVAAALLALVVFTGTPAFAAPAQVTTPRSGWASAQPDSMPQTAVPPPTVYPFQANIYATIPDGLSGGSDNGNVSPGTQTVLAPKGHKLVIQSVSIYRSGAITGTTVQAFVNAEFKNSYSSFALPLTPASTASYSGSTFTGNFYAQGGSEVLVNVFRNGTVGAESDTIVISGYLAN